MTVAELNSEFCSTS